MDSSTNKARKSVRTFNDRPIPDEIMAKLEGFTKHDANPFGVPIAFKFLDRKRDGVSSPVIVGANTYVAVKYRRQEDAELGLATRLSGSSFSPRLWGWGRCGLPQRSTARPSSVPWA